MDLSVLLEPTIDLPHIARVLNELGHSGRLDTLRAWSRSQRASLYDAALGFSPIGLEHFVPKAIGAMIEVIHDAKSGSGSFQKCFCRPAPRDENGGEELWGYSRREWQTWTGPGYFVAHTADTPGEVVIDYTRVPRGLLQEEDGGPPSEPKGWPQVLPSSARLGRFVDPGTVDVMRGLSKHVSIGRARRGDRAIDHWIVLCREDAD
jgi:hypothetical protein